MATQSGNVDENFGFQLNFWFGDTSYYQQELGLPRLSPATPCLTEGVITLSWTSSWCKHGLPTTVALITTSTSKWTSRVPCYALDQPCMGDIYKWDGMGEEFGQVSSREEVSTSRPTVAPIIPIVIQTTRLPTPCMGVKFMPNEFPSL